jgi:hypothetical protein
MKMDLSQFKKVTENGKSAILKHPKGHHIQIWKSSLDPKMKKQLEDLPLHAAGGTVVPDPNEEEKNYSAPQQQQPQPQQPVVQIFNGGAQPQQAQPNASMPPPAPEPAPMEAPAAAATQPQPQIDPRLRQLYNDFALQKDTNVQAANVGKPVIFGKQGEVPESIDADAYRKAKAELERINGQEAKSKAADAAKAAEQEKIKAELGMSTPQPMAPTLPQAGDQSMPPAATTTPSAPAPNADPYGMNALYNSTASAFDLKQKGLIGQAQAESMMAREQANALQQGVGQQQAFLQNYQHEMQKQNQEYDHFIHDYENQHIDPDHYFKSMGTPQRVSTIFGLIMGGLTGGQGALKMLNDQIGRDIESQKAEMTKGQNLLSANYNHYQNINQAASMTHAQMLGVMESKLRLAAAKAGDPLAQSRLLQLSADMQAERGKRLSEIALNSAVMNTMGGGAQGGGAGGGEPNLDLLRMVKPEFAKSLEERYVPGVGTAKVPLTAEVRQKLRTTQELIDATRDLRKFAKEHSGDLVGADKVKAEAMARLLQDRYRSAKNQGVFKESEKDFVSGVIDDSPLKFFNDWRIDPKFQALEDDAAMDLNSVKSAYGLPSEKDLGVGDPVRK